MSRQGARRLAGLASVLAIATVGLGGIAAAAPGDTGETEGEITIHKFENPPSTTTLPESNGTELPSASIAGLVPIEDVTFTFERLSNANLATNAGWEYVASSQWLVDPGATWIDEGNCTTLADGVCSPGTLPIGYYRVSETAAPDGVTKSRPFYVTLPLTDPVTLDSWVYDVHLYPKNTKTTVEKTAEDADATKVGDEVKFTITGDIPNGDIIFFGITDKLDSKLDYVSGVLDIVATNGSSVTLTAGTDYKLVANGQLISAHLTVDGIAKAKANEGGKVRLVITTTVNSVGEISNTAQVFPNQPWTGWSTEDPNQPVTPPDPETCDPDDPNQNCGIPTEPVETKFGGIKVLKQDANSASVLLSGAQFKVYASSSATFDSATATDVTATVCPSGCSTNSSGELVVEGLRYSGFADGATVSPGAAGYLYYWLEEVQAPSGYELLPEPVGFIVDGQSTAVSVVVKNVEKNGGWQLPLTGGNGVVVYYAAGALLVGAAVFALARSRKAAQK